MGWNGIINFHEYVSEFLYRLTFLPPHRMILGQVMSGVLLVHPFVLEKVLESLIVGNGEILETLEPFPGLSGEALGE